MKKTYKLTYQYQDIATVELTFPNCEDPIKAMVEFWYNWENDLEDAGGDYTRCFLYNLAKYIVRKGNVPSYDEGWDFTMGIKIIKWAKFEVDVFDIDIVELDH